MQNSNLTHEVGKPFIVGSSMDQNDYDRLQKSRSVKIFRAYKRKKSPKKHSKSRNTQPSPLATDVRPRQKSVSKRSTSDDKKIRPRLKSFVK